MYTKLSLNKKGGNNFKHMKELIELKNYMNTAIEEAKISLREGNNGFGAVIIHEKTIIASAHDTEESDNDPTSHAEINAIKIASQRIGKNLENCILISTHEPCPMCATAIVWANINTVVYGYSIEDSMRQGRRRIDIGCKEIFAKANKNVEIIEKVQYEECSYLYNNAVRKEIKKLRNCSDDCLRKYNIESTKKRLEWYRNYNEDDSKKGDDIKEKAFEIFLKRLNISRNEASIIEKTDKKILFHSKNFCPTLEACKILNLDTRYICKLYNEKSTDTLIKQIDPNLRFTRNYEKLRPYTDYCEEMIIIEE